MRIKIEHEGKEELLIGTIIKNVTNKDYILVSSHRHIYRNALTKVLNYETTATIDLV